MALLESGLLLPIRFYWNISEQDRYKRHSQGVALTELNYLYVDCTKLAPFQISFMNDSTALGIEMDIVCANGTVVTPLPYDASKWHEYVADGMYYLSYLGNDDFSGLTSNGLHYLVVTITTPIGDRSWYSDLFMIANCSTTPYEDDNYRTWTGADRTSLRKVDATDLRIFKK